MHIKAGIHHKNFAQIFALICSLDEVMLVAKSHSQSADFELLELTDFTENILAMRRVFLCEFVVFRSP